MSKKMKLTVPEQVAYMKDHCGIQFEICPEEDAITFLNNSNYFFKVKAFAKVYPKDRFTGKYVGVDFAYLRELSLLDAYLRKEIMSIAVDVEHFLKVGLMTAISENPSEDGYTLMESYFEECPHVRNEIQKKSKNSYCKDLTSKMEEEGYAVWNAIEVLTFGQFQHLYELYSRRNSKWNEKICNLVFPAKSIRNAAAHNNCLLNSLRNPYSAPKQQPFISAQVYSYVSQVPSLKKSKSKQTKLSNPVIHDFIALLFLFDKVCTSKETKRKTYQTLRILFHQKFVRNKAFFEKNEVIVSSYEFVVKVVDFLYNKAYNISVEQKSL